MSALENVVAEVSSVAAPHSESIRRRYTATFFAQAVQLCVSAVGAGVVPRALGPAEFGNYNFLLNMASTVRGLTEPSVQQAFFTFSAREDRTGALTRLYGVWVVVQLIAIIGLIVAAAVLGWTGHIWPGQSLDRILLITVVDWAVFLVVALKQLGDSKALTVRPQVIGALASALMLVGLIALAVAGQLTFYTFAALNLTAAIATCVPLGYWLFVVHGDRCWSGSVVLRASEYIRQWWRYASPLILIEYLTPLVALSGTYMIQAWYGSVEQGQLALATRWSTLVLLFTASATSIFWREIASAIGNGDHERAASTYRSFSQALAFVTMALGTWLAAGSGPLVTAVAGEGYAGAVPVLALMAFYPLQQTFGQLNGAALKAAGRTTQYRTIRMSLLAPELLLTYVLLAPRNAAVPGLELGAVGVALRMVAYGLVSVQVFEWRNAQYFGIPYGVLLKGRAAIGTSIGLLGVALWAATRTLTTRFQVNELATFVACSTFYGAAVYLLGTRLARGKLADLRDLSSIE